jgi:hypothetical protein
MRRGEGIKGKMQGEEGEGSKGEDERTKIEKG